MPISRRSALGGLAAAPALLAYGRAAAFGPERLFTFGIASGEPPFNGMVLWTRLAPKPLQSDGGMPARRVAVRLEVFADEAARRPVRSGEAWADPARGHSVHAEVDGLAADRPYWFRFTVDGKASIWDVTGSEQVFFNVQKNIRQLRTSAAAGLSPFALGSQTLFGSSRTTPSPKRAEPGHPATGQSRPRLGAEPSSG